jgi:hypothetical protein
MPGPHQLSSFFFCPKMKSARARQGVYLEQFESIINMRQPRIQRKYDSWLPS